MTKKAVVYFIYDRKINSVLVENRTPEQSLAGHQLFPGGKVDKSELNNLSLTLFREVKEELGIDILDFVSIDRPVVGVGGFTLYPFIITKWNGSIPEKVLDKGSVLEWIGINNFGSDIRPVQELHNIIKDYVAQCY